MQTREEKVSDLLGFIMKPEDLKMLEEFLDDRGAGMATAQARLSDKLDNMSVKAARDLKNSLIELAEVVGLAGSRLEDLYETITNAMKGDRGR